jgi:hypothetical protein
LLSDRPRRGRCSDSSRRPRARPGDVAAGFAEPPVVVPVDVLQGGDLELLSGAPGPAWLDQLGLEQAVYRLGQRVVVRVAAVPTEAGPNRRRSSAARLPSSRTSPGMAADGTAHQRDPMAGRPGMPGAPATASPGTARQHLTPASGISAEPLPGPGRGVLPNVRMTISAITAKRSGPRPGQVSGCPEPTGRRSTADPRRPQRAAARPRAATWYRR